MKTKTKKLMFVPAYIVLIAVGCTAYSNMDRSDELIAADRGTVEVAQAWDYPHIIGLINKEPTDLYEQYFGADAPIIRAICQAESGHQDIRSYKSNRNGTYDWGRCQVNEIHAWRVGGDIQSLLDPETNIKTSKDIYNDRKARDGIGWTAWSQYNNGKWKEFYEQN